MNKKVSVKLMLKKRNNNPCAKSIIRKGAEAPHLAF